MTRVYQRKSVLLQLLPLVCIRKEAGSTTGWIFMVCSFCMMIFSNSQSLSLLLAHSLTLVLSPLPLPHFTHSLILILAHFILYIPLLSFPSSAVLFEICNFSVLFHFVQFYPPKTQNCRKDTEL